jgi:DNA-damage-inducible protein D
LSNIKEYQEKIFEEIKHINEYGEEFWYARELQKVLDYSEWRNINLVINKAITACENSQNNRSDHFVDVNKTIAMPKGASEKVEDFMLSRYA